MKPMNAEFLIESRHVFCGSSAISLHDVKQRINAANDLAANRKRDLISALNRTEMLFGKRLSEIAATPNAVRSLFAGTTAAELNLSPKTLANIRSAVSRVVKDYGETPQPITKRIEPASDWQDLLDRISTKQIRVSLYRLACFCTAMKVSPTAVSGETLRGLHEALIAEELVKNPRAILKNTIANWNRCVRRVNGWPQQPLSSPFKQAPYTKPLAQFPKSFQKDVETYVDRLLNPDPLGEFGPDQPLRKSTVDHRTLQILQFASAMIHRDSAEIGDITSLAFLFDINRFKEAVRFFLDRSDGQKTQRIHNQVNALRHIAKHHCKCDQTKLKQLNAIAKKLHPGPRRRMTPQNRDRLRQFEDPANIARLLAFPEQQTKLAKAEQDPVRAARRVERAVIVSLLTRFGLRIGSLRLIEIDSDLKWSRPDRQGVCHLSLPGEKVKTGNPLEFEIPHRVAEIARLYLYTYRHHLPGADSTWLFAGSSGGPRSKNALRESVTRALRKEAGLVMNPHLFRHTMAKIIVEQDAGAYPAVARVLGHTSLDTTTGHYLGTETKASARYIDDVLDKMQVPPSKSRRR